MATRVNTRFVIALIAVLVILTLGLVGGWYYIENIHNSPEKLVRQSEELIQQGEFDRAAQLLGKALHKRQSHTPTLLRYAEVIQMLRTNDRQKASEKLGLLIRSLDQVLVQEPGHPRAYDQLMQLFMRLGREHGDFSGWNGMFERSSSLLQVNPESLQGRKYRGIANVNRMEKLNLGEDERQETLTDLQAVMDNNPDDQDAVYYLAAWHVLQSRTMGQTGIHGAQSQEHKTKAKSLMERTQQAHPDDLSRKIDRLRVLLLLDEREDPDTLSLLAEIEATLIQDASDSWLIRVVGQMLPQVDQTPVEADQAPGPVKTVSGLLRAEKVLRAGLERHPGDIMLLMPLARCLEFQQRNPEAIELYKQISEAQSEGDLFFAMQLGQLKAGASIKYADLLLTESRKRPAAEREQMLSQVEALIKQVVDNFGESPDSLLTEGKLLIAQKRWQQALVKIDLANSHLKEGDPEALLLSAEVRKQLGELGAATERLERLVQLRPQYKTARYELISIYLRMNQLTQAREHIDLLLGDDPDNQWGKRYQADLLARQGQIGEAIKVYETLDTDQMPGALTNLATYYAASGDRDKARQIILEQYERDPSDVGTLQVLMRYTTDPEQGEAYLARSEEAGASSDVIGIIRSRYRGDGELSEVVESLIEQEDDPVVRLIKQYTLYQQTGKKEEAVAVLEEAATKAPDHPGVISLQFDQALVKRDWSFAETLASRASTLNLDRAEGMFFYGRLEFRMGRFDRAISSYRRGLRLRPVYSEGWRRLGDAQRLNTDMEEASQSYERSLEQRPDNIGSLRGYAAVLDALGDHTAALEALRQASRFRPTDETLRAQRLAYEDQYGDSEQALSLRQRLAQVLPKDQSNRRAIAILQAKLGRADSALGTINTLIDEVGLTQANVRTAADVHAELGDPKAGRALIQKYVNELGDKANEEDWLILGRFIVRHEEVDDALAAYRRGVAVENPDTRRATRELADLLFEKGRAVESIEHYNRLWETFTTEKRVGNRYVEALLRGGQLDRAQVVLAQVVEGHGESIDTLVLEALISDRQGDKERALTAMNRAVELNPERAVIYYQRAQLVASDHNSDAEAIADLRQALTLDPEMKAARGLLAAIHTRRGEREEAIRELVELLKAHPDEIPARLRLAQLYMRAEAAVPLKALLDETAKLYPSAPLWPRLQSQQAFREGNLPLAIEKMTMALEMAPTLQTLAELIAMLIEAEKPQDALTILRDHSRLVSGVPQLQGLRAKALLAVGSEEQSVNTFRLAVSQCGTYNELATVIRQIIDVSDHERAAEIMESVEAPDRPELIEMGLAQIASDVRDYKTALARLRMIDSRIAAQTPDRISYDRMLGLCLQQLEMHEEALGAYQRVIRDLPTDTVSLNNAAFLLADVLGKPQDALPLARRAATESPDDPLVLDTLGWVLFQSGDADQAYMTLQRSYEAAPSAVNCLHMGDVMLSMGNPSGAQQMYLQAQELAKESEDQQMLETATKRLDKISR